MKFYIFLTILIFTKVCFATYHFGISPSDVNTQKLAVEAGLGWEMHILSISVILNSQYSEKDFVDTPIPHSNYTNLGEKRIGSDIGIDYSRKFDIEALPLLHPYLGIGLYMGRRSTIVKSNVSDTYWAQNNTSMSLVGFFGGFILGEDEKINFGLGYHNIKGLSLSLIIPATVK